MIMASFDEMLASGFWGGQETRPDAKPRTSRDTYSKGGQFSEEKMAYMQDCPMEVLRPAASKTPVQDVFRFQFEPWCWPRTNGH